MAALFWMGHFVDARTKKCVGSRPKWKSGNGGSPNMVRELSLGRPARQERLKIMWLLP
jgi:hypothetical protein